MSASNPHPTCNAYENSDDRPTCTRDTHARRHGRASGTAPTTELARERHDRTQAIAGVLAGDWGAATPYEVELAAPTLECVCPVHGVRHAEY